MPCPGVCSAVRASLQSTVVVDAMSSPDLQPPLSPDPFQESPLPDHSLAILRRLDREIERRASSWMQILELTVRDLADAFAHFNWTGVYLVEGDDLVLGPYVGLPTEHVRIPIGRGICGAAAATGSTIVVDDCLLYTSPSPRD